MKRPIMITIYLCFLIVVVPFLAVLYLVTVVPAALALLMGLGLAYLQISMVERAVRFVALSRYMKVEERNGLLFIQGGKK